MTLFTIRPPTDLNDHLRQRAVQKVEDAQARLDEAREALANLQPVLECEHDWQERWDRKYDGHRAENRQSWVCKHCGHRVG